MRVNKFIRPCRHMSSTTVVSLGLKIKPDFQPAPKLTVTDLNPHTVNAKYAVRGKIPTKAELLRNQLNDVDHKLPFTKIISANIGNPQQLDQKPLTFYRQILALLQYPPLLDDPRVASIFPKDIIERARSLLKQIGSVGAYSQSQGVPSIRQSIADFISRRDGHPCARKELIYLTTGASTAVTYLLTLLGQNEKTGFLIPIPQYPLYTATLTLNNRTALPYYLNEEDNWSIECDEIESIILDSKAKGIDPRCLIVINPGNPTGAILSYEAIEDILNVCAKYGLVVIADEVYQENIFDGKFISVRKVLLDLLQGPKADLYKNIQLASLHSTSKGISGECGQRGGYMELIGFDESVLEQITKLSSISLCPVVTGQALVELMINPPKEGDESYKLYYDETRAIHDSLAERATKLYDAFNSMEGVVCRKPQGAMYCFPKITIPEKAIKTAKELDFEPDEFYCNELLETTGICAVPGSGFGQKPGTYHIRTTFLAPGSEWINDWVVFHKKFMQKYK
ncbi:Alanine transaminase [Komagataella phaffii CBS 7435]|uniref:Glutamate pyruvate transaminase n=2 Tax=Komagataella phaffii TaxID=460519 RepID=C4R4P4_KOMPG|nr:Putative alanine transaminase (glutamic pyruvic transaminase) [Komagataella phaffii GS115]AOA63257.1 GQ67_03554T0 [Komagataella phaffii]CAH2449709.1 Alanine transaminase [Komagataella phaffii CBS 7435]AOA68205.1 GQ68_03524T0 [Komagataella phaffii GS115]CAY70530.1 Putative alanine transaminase (glutamic pyruvic transaminase) [Komagataella phaffii GS115]CCA39682.1 Alanine transaminase [Komagataella phaffii CBS 7435]